MTTQYRATAEDVNALKAFQNAAIRYATMCDLLAELEQTTERIALVEEERAAFKAARAEWLERPAAREILIEAGARVNF